MLYDGSSMVILNGEVLGQSSQFSLLPVEITVATVDLSRVRSYRSANAARNVQAAHQREYPRVTCDLRLSRPSSELVLSGKSLTHERAIKLLDPMEEIYLATSTYLWQYLCRTSSGGFFLALSGGLDSSSVALFVYGMAKTVHKSIQNGEETTLDELRRLVGIPDYNPETPEDIVSKLLHTTYMGTSNSSEETRSRAKRLAQQIGAYHTDLNMDKAVAAHESLIGDAFDGFQPKYESQGGTVSESLAKQNIQARNRLVISYELAQVSLQARGMPRAGASLLVLGSGNVDENLRGYYTKYDASYADLSPLGSISKTDAKNFQRWAEKEWNMPILTEFLEATPTAELLPLSEGVAVQSDEEEMGLTYAELSEFGILRKVHKLGPWSTYLRLLAERGGKPGGPRFLAEKVMRFFRFYSINRHKTTTLTPAVHLVAYNPDDNRHDLRPFLYNVNWPWQFNKIREHVAMMEKSLEERGQGE